MPPAPSRSSSARPPATSADASLGGLFRRTFTFDRLEVVSLIHSTIYFALLISAFALDGPEPYTFVFGLLHGLIWIAMALLSVVGVHFGVINLRLAIAIAVLGCIAPFFGSAEFLRQKHQRKVAAAGAARAGAARPGAVRANASPTGAERAEPVRAKRPPTESGRR